MRPLLVLSALTAIGMAQAQEARYDVFLGGKKGGVATYLIKYDAKGRMTRLRMSLADGTVTETLSLSDPTGAAVRMENTVRRGNARSKEVVTFSPRGDATIVTDGGKPMVVPFDRRGSRKDPSELWFHPTIPSNGTWAIYRSLDPRKRVWDEVKVTYVGKRVKGHLVEQRRNGVLTQFTMDPQGVPLVIESGSLRMVRR